MSGPKLILLAMMMVALSSLSCTLLTGAEACESDENCPYDESCVDSQ
jgi:hypothetical protein